MNFHLISRLFSTSRFRKKELTIEISNAAYPAFFKILTATDFSTVLRIPPAFTKKYKLDLTANVKLVIVDSGGIWNVKMKRKRNGSVFCFTHGWPRFVADAALQFGEFLVFSLSANSQFHVHIYKTNFCQRQIPPLPLPPPPTATADGKRKKSKGISVGRSQTAETDLSSSKSKRGNPLYFEASIKTLSKYRLYVPVGFMRASGLSKEKHVRVEYVGNNKLQYECSMIVALEKRVGVSGMELALGWSQFRVASRLVRGIIYSFEFDPNRKLILVKEKGHQY